MLVYLLTIDSKEDKAKFETLYLEYRGLMFYVANSILHNNEDSEDAVHQAFIKIAENIEKIQDPSSKKTKSFVITIVEHAAIDIYRYNQKRRKISCLEDCSGLSTEDYPDNELATCILHLPPRYRQAILLKYYHGFSCKEISKILNISTSNAEKLIQRAKNKLQQLCLERGIL